MMGVDRRPGIGGFSRSLSRRSGDPIAQRPLSPASAAAQNGAVLQGLERLTNKLVLGMLAAVFVSGLAVLMAVYHRPGWEQ